VPRRIAFSPICAGPRCGYVAAEDLKPIIAVSVGIAVFRGIVTPLLARYLAWRNGPRVQIARRDWRGVYVPDLNVERGERVFWPAYLRVVALGLAIGWRVMASS
jgi:hypothetical protein